MSDPATSSATEPVRPLPATPLDPEPKKSGSDLPKRLISAGILIPLVAYVIVTGGWPFLIVVLALILLGQREFYRLIEDKGAHPSVGFGLGAAAALTLVQYFGSDYQANLLMTATLLITMVLQLGKAHITEALSSISGTFFGVFYIGWLLSHAISVRFFHDAVAMRYGEAQVAALGIDHSCGIFLMFFTLVAVIGCDTGAYFGGRAYGKRPLAPAISPNKSIEGAIAGIGLGVLLGLACKGTFDFFWPQLSAAVSWTVAGVLALLLSVAGIFGDLIESLLKRDAQVKDAGQLLPGMGGILDRIDSNLVGLPVMYYAMLFYTFIRVS